MPRRLSNPHDKQSVRRNNRKQYKYGQQTEALVLLMSVSVAVDNRNIYSLPHPPYRLALGTMGRCAMQNDRPLIGNIHHILEIDPGVFEYNRSNMVNDYLALGWILLNTGVRTAEGETGPRSWVYFVVGWPGDGEPAIPPR